MAADDKYPESDPERDVGRGGDDTPPAASGTDSSREAAADGTDAPPAQTEPPFSVAFGDNAKRVDRGDNSSGDGASSGLFVDSDYPQDFPEMAKSRDEDETPGNDPDPGFAALPGDFDDPLADWPAPSTDIDSLPEMRTRASSGDDAGKPTRDDSFGDDPFADDPFADDPFGDDPFADDPFGGDPLTADTVDRAEAGDADKSGLLADDLGQVAFFDDPVEPDARDDDFGTPSPEPLSGNTIADSDEPASVAAADASPASGSSSGLTAEAGDATQDLPTAREVPLPAVSEPPYPPDIEDVDEDAYGDVDDLPPIADSGSRSAVAIGSSTMADAADEDAFIDDFLNDLDEADDADLRETPGAYGRDVAAAPLDEADDSAMLPQGSGGRTSGSAAVAQYGAGILDASDGPADPPTMREGEDEKVAAGTDDNNPGLPWGMIAVVAVALLLLAAGGFGVVQQRSSLKAEIRDLQAQLATAVAPEEAAAERERLRRMELENESLAAELAALEAENGALSQQLENLEVRLDEQVSAQESAAREAEAAAAAALRAAQSPEPARSGNTSPPAQNDSGWFVNFGSYAQEQIARRWADRLDVDSGRVVVQEARASGKTLYRVRVVGLPTQDMAERVATALERQHQLPRLWVGRS